MDLFGQQTMQCEAKLKPILSGFITVMYLLHSDLRGFFFPFLFFIILMIENYFLFYIKGFIIDSSI